MNSGFPGVGKKAPFFSNVWKILLACAGLAAPGVFAADCTTLADATHAPAHPWTTGGDAVWFAQTNVTREPDSCAAQAGPITDEQRTHIQTEVSGAGVVTFYWKVSSEAGYDKLSFYINGVLTQSISGAINWQYRQYETGGGVSTLKWEYAKDDGVTEREDTGWMTDFVFQPYTGRMLMVSGDLAFGRVEVGQSSQRVVIARNPGTEAATATGIVLPEYYSAASTNFTIAPGGSNLVAVTFAPTAIGVFTGMLAVVSDAQGGAYTLPVSGQGFIRADRFVATNSPSPAAPYTNWTTAAHTLQEALDYAGEDDTVWVTNGVYDRGGAVAYACTNRAVVGTGVVLRSVNGPEVTHIVGAADPAATNAFGLGPAAVRGVALLGNATLQGFTVRDGRCSSEAHYGGGVIGAEQEYYESELPSKMLDCILVGNAATFGGGAAMVNAQRCLVVSNRAEYGGGIANAMAGRCRIAGNRAQTGGGGYIITASNCVITANTATYAGGGVVGGWLVMDGCTVVGNQAPMCGGISQVTAHNSLIYHNTATIYPNYASATLYLGSYLYFSCATPLATGSDGLFNIADDPAIVSLSDPHLLAASPCINAGTNKPWMETALDQDGEPRLNGSVDMGADEFWAGGLTDALHVAISLPMGSLVAPDYPLSIVADIVGRCSQTTWELDGLTLTNLALFTHSFSSTGVYEVRLTASNLLGTVSAVATVTVQEVAYYVATNGSDAADGLSWAAAKQTIQAAVDACTAPGGMVWVSNGVYATGGMAVDGLSNRVVITSPIRVRSVNGPDATFIHGAPSPGSTHPYGCGSNAVRCAYLGGGASLEGFTLAAGRTDVTGLNGNGGGVFCATMAERISNCVVVGCAAARYGGGAYQGTFTDCALEYNAAGLNGGGAYQTMLHRSRVVGNRAGSGGGLSSGDAWNCLIADNTATNAGGTDYTDLYNCTVIANEAMSAGGAQGGKCVNTILYYNDALLGPNWHSSGIVTPPEFSHSCTTPMPDGGTNNFTGTPMVAGLRNAHLLPGSPCIGAGVTQEWMAAATDCDGEPRLDGASVDVGWDQFWPAGCTDALEMGITFPFGARVAPGMALPMIADDEAGRPLHLSWSFGATNEAVTSHAWADAGEKVITLTATNISSAVTVIATVRVETVVQHVAPSGNDGADGFAWTSAKQTIQAAVDASVYGGLVLASNGVYDTGERAFGTLVNSNRVILTNAVTLRSVNGPEVSIIAGKKGPQTNDPSSVRCVLMGPNTRIEGFSLANGHGRAAYQRDYGGGAWCMDLTPVLSNCVISGCSAWESGGGVYRGRVFNSRIEGCLAFEGGGASQAHLFDCMVVSNRARDYDGGGLADGMAVRCAISHNATDGSGGGAARSLLSNCIVRANTCAGIGGGLQGGAAYNCLVVDNTAMAGGGASGVELVNGTLAGNSSGLHEGSALNSIVFGNGAMEWQSSDSSQYRYTCTTPLPEGAGCITENPLLAGDYRLASNSPCVNRGLNEPWMAGAADLAGSNRIQNAVVDMGAYESFGWGMVADVDGDDFTDWTEVYIAGTDPTNASSFLQVSGFRSQDLSASGLVVRWASVAGKLYNVDRATDLVAPAPFTNIFTGVTGLPDYTSVTDTTATAEGPYFYRVMMSESAEPLLPRRLPISSATDGSRGHRGAIGGPRRTSTTAPSAP